MLGIKLLELVAEYERGEAYGDQADARPVEDIAAEVEATVKAICVQPPAATLWDATEL